MTAVVAFLVHTAEVILSVTLIIAAALGAFESLSRWQQRHDDRAVLRRQQQQRVALGRVADRSRRSAA